MRNIVLAAYAHHKCSFSTGIGSWCLGAALLTIDPLFLQIVAVNTDQLAPLPDNPSRTIMLSCTVVRYPICRGTLGLDHLPSEHRRLAESAQSNLLAHRHSLPIINRMLFSVGIFLGVHVLLGALFLGHGVYEVRLVKEVTHVELGCIQVCLLKLRDLL
jgi:hypothetical protein